MVVHALRDGEADGFAVPASSSSVIASSGVVFDIVREQSGLESFFKCGVDFLDIDISMKMRRRGKARPGRINSSAPPRRPASGSYRTLFGPPVSLPLFPTFAGSTSTAICTISIST